MTWDDFPPSVIEHSFPLNEEESRILMTKGNMVWVRQNFKNGDHQDGPRHVFDLDMLPHAEVALLSPTEARIRYRDGRQKRIAIGGINIVISDIETKEESDDGEG